MTTPSPAERKAALAAKRAQRAERKTQRAQARTRADLAATGTRAVAARKRLSVLASIHRCAAVGLVGLLLILICG